MIRYWLFLLLLLNASTLNAVEAISIKDLKEGSHFGEQIHWLQGAETFEHISQPAETRFTKGTKAILSYGWSKDPYWFHFALRNDETTPRTVYLFSDRNSEAELTIYQDGQLIRSLGHEETLRHRVIALNIPATHESQIYVKRRNDYSNNITWTLWLSEKKLYLNIAQLEGELIAILSIIFMSLLFNVMLFVVYRDRVYAFYLGYLLSFSLFTIWTYSVFNIPWVTSRGGACVGALTALFIVAFARDFLGLSNGFRLWDRILKAGSLAYALGLVLALFDPVVGGKFCNTTVSIVTPFVLMAGFKVSRSRRIHASIFTVACGLMLVSAILQSLTWLGYLSFVRILFYGITLENVLMLVAMGHKIYSTEIQRASTYQQAKHSYDQLAKVFYLHQLKQMQSGMPLESTMPIGRKEAVVISFDIAGSSRINHAKLKDALEEFFGRCRNLISKNYDPEHLVANGYIVKEMGDGFLCTVGFPFRPPQDNEAVCAVELAEKFIREFMTTVEESGMDERIYCATGLALGQVEGYFSRSEVVRYDLFGQGLILATRYESLRKTVLRHLPISNFIILQEKVYRALSPEAQTRFKEVDLLEGKFEVRNDPGAARLYYLALDYADRLNSSADKTAANS